MAVLQVPGESISSKKVYNKQTIFRYEPTDNIEIQIWCNEDNYTVQIIAHNQIYSLTGKTTKENAYAAQQEIINSLNDGADVIVTGLNTARLESLEDKLKRKNE